VKGLQGHRVQTGLHMLADGCSGYAVRTLEALEPLSLATPGLAFAGSRRGSWVPAWKLGAGPAKELGSACDAPATKLGWVWLRAYLHAT